MVRLKRAYEQPRPRDGYRVLVERLWPRGLRKTDAHLDEWLKELAPSSDLRKWFGHDPNRFREFQERYKRELESPIAQQLLEALASLAARKTVTLVYSTHDAEHNNAVVLERELRRRLRPRGPKRRASTRRKGGAKTRSQPREEASA